MYIQNVADLGCIHENLSLPCGQHFQYHQALICDTELCLQLSQDNDLEVLQCFCQHVGSKLA